MRTFKESLSVSLMVLVISGCNMSDVDPMYSALGGEAGVVGSEMSAGDSGSPYNRAAVVSPGATGSTGGSNGGANGGAAPVEEDIRSACERSPQLAAPFMVSFPAMTQGCKWNQNGNASTKDREFRARASQSKPLPMTNLIPSGSVMCGFELLGGQNQYTKFDDEVFLNLRTKNGTNVRNTILASSVDYSDRFLNELGQSGILYYMYDFSRLIYSYYDAAVSNGNNYYCLGMDEGSQCNFPATETYGTLFAKIVPSATYKLSEWVAGASEVSIDEVVTGDNDSTDCQITALNFTVTVKYAHE